MELSSPATGEKAAAGSEGTDTSEHDLRDDGVQPTALDFAGGGFARALLEIERSSSGNPGAFAALAASPMAKLPYGLFFPSNELHKQTIEVQILVMMRSVWHLILSFWRMSIVRSASFAWCADAEIRACPRRLLLT